MARRPTFFLSSTIYDFRDLRGAIKFSLEERGCRVLASEFNDFGGTLDLHSYESCLANIEQADFFVLLVGGRVGGWYNSSQRVSITQQEYRAAYALHRSGRLRLVNFVRSEVWQLKEDRKELARFLKDQAVEEAERCTIAGAPSKFANDAEFVAAFLTEIGRNAETGMAVATGSVKPTGNWIHQFRDFRDIHDVLAPLAFTGLTSEEAAYRKALQHELLSIMAKLLSKSDGQVKDWRRLLMEGVQVHPITLAMRDAQWMSVDLKRWNDFTTLFFEIIGVTLETLVIDDALTSTIFLDYDGSAGSYVHTPAHNGLARLRQAIRQFHANATLDTFEILYETSPRALGRKSGLIDLPSLKVAQLYNVAHCWIDILNLTQALILHLEGRPYIAPILMPTSPIAGMGEKIEAEQVSVQDLRTALGLVGP